MKKIIKLWKVFTSSRKKVISIVLVGMLLGLISNMTQLVFMSNETELTRYEIEKYGSYGVRIGDCTDEDYKKLKRYPNAATIKKTERYTITVNEEIYYIEYAPNFDLHLMGLKLVKGELPTSDTQLVIDENYVSEKGYDHSIIGQKINIPISEKEEKAFLVTGIISKNSAWLDRSSEFRCLAFRENYSYNCAYASFHDYTDLDADYNRLEKILAGKIYPNQDMYISLGYAFGGLSVFEQYDLIYDGVFVFMLLAMCFVVYNIAKMCIFDTRESIGVMRLLGVKRDTIIASFVSGILFLILIGILLGALLAVAVVVMFHVGLYHTLLYFWSIWTIYPVKKMFLSIIICLVIIILVLLPLIICIKCMSPNELLREDSIFEKHKNNKGKKLFRRNTKRVCMKLAGNDIRYEKFMNIISVFGIALGMVIITTAIFYMETNYAVIEGNYQYQYKIDLLSDRGYRDDNYHTEVSHLYKNNYGFSDSVQIHAQFIDCTNIDVSPKRLSDRYAKYLSRDPDNYRKIMRNQNISTRVYILGYEDIEIERLYKENGMTPEKLVENEIIVLDYLYSTSMESKNFRSPFRKLDEIVFSESGNDNVKVKDTVSKLTIYPETEELSTVIIVNTKTFQKLFSCSLPRCIYLNNVTEKEDLENMELLESNKYFQVYRPLEEKEELERLNRILRVFVYVIFFICIGVAVLLIYSSYYLKIYINRKEYAMLHTIGLHTKKVQRIVMLEMLFSYVFGIMFSFFVSYILTEKIYLIKYPLAGTYLYQFPIDTYGISVIITLMVSSSVWYFILKKLKSVLNIHVLKAL